MVNKSTTVINPMVIDPQLKPHDLRDLREQQPHERPEPEHQEHQEHQDHQDHQEHQEHQEQDPSIINTPPLLNSLLNSPPPSQDLEYPGSLPRRVKVYILNGEDWLDNGTGYCVGEITNCPYFLVRNELDSKDVILRSSLEGAIQFQRQQETLIVWTDLDGKDLALSFQEVDGCNDLCEFIKLVQHKGLSPNISLYYITTNVLENGEDQTELIAGPITYPPPPTIQNLKLVLQLLNQNLNSKFIKTKLTEYMVEEDYLKKLIEVFGQLESDIGGNNSKEEGKIKKAQQIDDQTILRVTDTNCKDVEGTTSKYEKSLEILIAPLTHKIPTGLNENEKLMNELLVESSIFQHPSFDLILTLYDIFKTLVLFNEPKLVEEILNEEILFGVIGIFEYDNITSKSFHRSNLVKNSFKIILPIANLQIFKTDFYLNFLKDVVLVKIMDDRVFSTISSMIFNNRLEVIRYLKGGVLQGLFDIYSLRVFVPVTGQSVVKEGVIAEVTDGLIENSDKVLGGVSSDLDSQRTGISTDSVTIKHDKSPSSPSDTSLTLKRDGVRMLHQYVLIAKSLQMQQKLEFFSVLVKNGLFRMIGFALNDDDKKIRELGTELIVIIIEQDATLVNSMCDDEREDHLDPMRQQDIRNTAENEQSMGEEQLNINEAPQIKREDPNADETTDSVTPLRLNLSDDMTLVAILAKVLVEDNNPGLKLQAVEALKILLDRNIAVGEENENEKVLAERNGTRDTLLVERDEASAENLKDQDKLSCIQVYCKPNLANVSSPSPDFTHVNTTNYFRAFYAKVAPQLFQPLIELCDAKSAPSLSNFTLYQHLCELITYCSKEHDTHLSRQFFLESHILLGVSRLLEMRCKLQLKLSAVKCIKNIVLLNDDFYSRYIINHGVLDHFFNYFSTISSANHVVNSSCLDFMEIIVRNCDSNLHIKRDNFKLLADYIYINFKEFCETEISYASTGRELVEMVEHDYYEDTTCNGSYLQAVRNEIIDDSDDYMGKNETISDGEGDFEDQGATTTSEGVHSNGNLDSLPQTDTLSNEKGVRVQTETELAGEIIESSEQNGNTSKNQDPEDSNLERDSKTNNHSIDSPTPTNPAISTKLPSESLIKHSPTKKRSSRNIFSENSSKKIARSTVSS